MNDNSRKVKYKTFRQYESKNGIGLSLFIFIFGCIGLSNVSFLKDEPYMFYVEIVMGILSAGLFVYSISWDVKRKKYKNKGEHIPGYIIGAEKMQTLQFPDIYHLLISFDDNGEKIKYTESYTGDPNIFLASRNCSIYKYKDKYIEADLVVTEESQESADLGIPVSEYHRGSKKKYF